MFFSFSASALLTGCRQEGHPVPENKQQSVIPIGYLSATNDGKPKENKPSRVDLKTAFKTETGNINKSIEDSHGTEKRNVGVQHKPLPVRRCADVMQWVENVTTNKLVNLIEPVTSYCWRTDNDRRQWTTIGRTKLLTSCHIHRLTTTLQNQIYIQNDKITTVLL